MCGVVIGDSVVIVVVVSSGVPGRAMHIPMQSEGTPLSLQHCLSKVATKETHQVFFDFTLEIAKSWGRLFVTPEYNYLRPFRDL